MYRGEAKVHGEANVHGRLMYMGMRGLMYMGED